MTGADRDWLTTAEIAVLHLMKPESVVRWIRRGVKSPTGKRVRLVGTKIGNGWRVSKTDLDAFIVALRSVAPEELGETETQFQRRAAEEQRRALAALGN